MQDKLLDQSSVSHLFPITKYLGLLATGVTGISRALFRFTYRYIMKGALFVHATYYATEISFGMNHMLYRIASS